MESRKRLGIVLSIAIVAVLLAGCGTYLFLNKGPSSQPASLAQSLYSIYTNPLYSTSTPPACLKDYIQSGKDSQDFNIEADSACAPYLKGLDAPTASSTSEGLVDFILLHTIVDNPMPLSAYLAENRQSSSTDEYVSLYSDLLISQAFAENKNNDEDTDMFLQNELLSYDPDLKSSLASSFEVDTMPVASSTDLALVDSLYASGAYNIFGSLYKVDFASDTLDIKPAVILITNATGVSVFDQNANPDDPTSGIVNGGLSTEQVFGAEEPTFNMLGFLPFGIYPCNGYDTYEFYKDRLILVSTTQPKGCENADIQGPNDIPDNFDTTDVQIYKISPKILQQAETMKI